MSHPLLGLVEGTSITTPAGEIPVETLRIGDVVATLHGGNLAIKWRGQRTTDTAIHIRRGALDDGIPAADLTLAPGHCLYLDGALIPAAKLVNGVTITRQTSATPQKYYHIEFAEHELIFAQNCPVESLSENDFHAQFENFADYRPPPLAGPAVLCLPRVQDGFVLQAAQRRLAERAGIPDVVKENGPLRGFVDHAGPVLVTGWAQCETQPEELVCLDIVVNGERVLRALANLYRPDLQSAGLGSGNHGFIVELPEEILGTPEVRRSLDQTPLPRSRS
jgi:hypothetical protein